MTSGKQRTSRSKLAEMRAAEAKAAKRRQLNMLAAVGVVGVLVIGASAWAATRDSGKSSSDSPPVSHSGGTAMPPWPAPADPDAGVKAAGLSLDAMEGARQHFHTHLDILVDGKPVTVPANLGINTSTQVLADLHTHDDTGILHIEAHDPNAKFTLGQLFTEWGVKLDASNLGGLKASGDKPLAAYVNGKKLTGDPSSLVLKAHQEIVLAYGKATDIPKSYDFPDGV